MYRAVFVEKKGWRVFYNDMDLCGATSERVATETALCLQDYRRVHGG